MIKKKFFLTFAIITVIFSNFSVKCLAEDFDFSDFFSNVKVGVKAAFNDTKSFVKKNDYAKVGFLSALALFGTAFVLSPIVNKLVQVEEDDNMFVKFTGNSAKLSIYGFALGCFVYFCYKQWPKWKTKKVEKEEIKEDGKKEALDNKKDNKKEVKNKPNTEHSSLDNSSLDENFEEVVTEETDEQMARRLQNEWNA